MIEYRRQGPAPAAAALAAALLAWSAAAQTPAPTPGPATRAGQAIDKAVATASKEVSEALIGAQVRIALLEHLKQDGLGVSIDVEGDRVTLAGKVSRRSSQELASEVAASVKGVRSVKNRVKLEVESAGSSGGLGRTMSNIEKELNDAMLEARVKARLIDEVGRGAFDIEVEATDGVVSLAGSVPDATRRERVRDITRSTKGVVEMHDLLRIAP